MLSPRALARSTLMDDAGEANIALTRLLMDARRLTGQLPDIDPNGSLRRQADDLRHLADAVLEALDDPRPSMPGALAPSL